jgi:hypothetical protein
LSTGVEAKLQVPAAAVAISVRAIAGDRFTALPVPSVSDILAAFKSADDNYRSCCRSALGYAVTGSREWAFGALRVTASKHDDWARHHPISGLIHGVYGDYAKALPELERARPAEPIEDVRGRIGAAVELCWIALEVPAGKARDSGLLPTMLARLPQTVRLLLELMDKANPAGR